MAEVIGDRRSPVSGPLAQVASAEKFMVQSGLPSHRPGLVLPYRVSQSFRKQPGLSTTLAQRSPGLEAGRSQ